MDHGAATTDAEAAGSPASSVKMKPTGRPACFKSTSQEVLFVLTATMAIAMSSFMVGITVVMTNFIAEDLNMTTAELTWTNAANT